MATEDSFSSDSTISEDDTKLEINYDKIWKWFWSILQGDCNVISRTVNITQVLGSVTVCSLLKFKIIRWLLRELICVSYLYRYQSNLSQIISKYFLQLGKKFVW